MPNKYEPQYDDSWCRPEDADTKIGMAGVPLSQTCGYTGMIRRAVMPTNDVLGFDPDYKSVDARKIATEWATLFNAALEKRDVDAVVDLIHEDGYWRDIFMLTWDKRGLRGRQLIKHMLTECLAKTGIRNVTVLDDRAPEIELVGDDLGFVSFQYAFDHAYDGTGTGCVRLSPFKAKTGAAQELASVDAWQAFTVSTTIETLMGYDPNQLKPEQRDTRAKLVDPLGFARTYSQIRADDAEFAHGAEPAVLIIGAGHVGLMTAARFKVLGVPTLVIEKSEAPGSSWAHRYASLSLHNPTYMNHFPYIPFPTHFPEFIPAQQLSKFMRNYAEMMDLNIWCHSEIDGENAVYDDATGRWTVTVNRKDTPQRIMHPKHIIVCVGITGTLPNLPHVEGLADFTKAGGVVVHSAYHRTTPEMRGKKAVIVGAATSAHDLCWELHDNGLDVTMIQRSATNVISVKPGVEMYYAKFKTIGKQGGYTLQSADRSFWMTTPFPVSYELWTRLFTKIKTVDKKLIESIEAKGYHFNDGFHGGGAGALTVFNLGGYFFDTGICQIIADGHVKIEHSEVDHLEAGVVVLKDGKRLPADICIYASGYFDTKTPIWSVMGKKMADKVNEFQERGNAHIISPEGEQRTYFRQLKQKGLYSAYTQFGGARFLSHRLALVILAQELGIDTTPYGPYPDAPRTAVTVQTPSKDNQIPGFNSVNGVYGLTGESKA